MLVMESMPYKRKVELIRKNLLKISHTPIYILKQNMTYELNSFKTFKDNGILVICGMMIAIFGMLLPLSRWASYSEEEKAESETETAWTMENEFPFAIETNSKSCEEEIKQELRNIISWIQDEDWFITLIGEYCECNYKQERIDRAYNQRNAEWYPWQLTEDGDHQEMPPISENISDSHERFKELASAYNLEASKFRQVENHYWIKEWVILCITIAETSGGWRWYGKTNRWNVGNYDRWDRVQYAFFETWLEKIGQTLTNRYLWKKQTLGCLSNAWSCVEPYDNGSRYATSEWNRQKNMVACLSTIYWPINASNFSIRR